MFLFGILNTASTGLATLLNVGLAVVGLVYVRRVNTMAGLLMAGAGALGAFASIIRRLVGLVASFFGGTAVFTASQIFTTLLSIAAGVLLPLAIFLLANSIKQGARPSS
jgi:hypothetical protein